MRSGTVLTTFETHNTPCLGEKTPGVELDLILTVSFFPDNIFKSNKNRNTKPILSTYS